MFPLSADVWKIGEDNATADYPTWLLTRANPRSPLKSRHCRVKGLGTTTGSLSATSLQVHSVCASSLTRDTEPTGHADELPEGSFQSSCKTCSVSAEGVLQCESCKNAEGEWQPAMASTPASQCSFFSNKHGQLVCDKPLDSSGQTIAAKDMSKERPKEEL